MNKKNFTTSYQTVFIYGCLNKGTNENFNKFLNENKDLGLFSEVEFLSHGVVKDADSLGRIYAGKIQPINYGAARDGMPYFAGCIYFSQSEEVLTIIKKYYNKLKKGKLTYDYED